MGSTGCRFWEITPEGTKTWEPNNSINPCGSQYRIYPHIKAGICYSSDRAGQTQRIPKEVCSENKETKEKPDIYPTDGYNSTKTLVTTRAPQTPTDKNTTTFQLLECFCLPWAEIQILSLSFPSFQTLNLEHEAFQCSLSDLSRPDGKRSSGSRRRSCPDPSSEHRLSVL